MNSKNSQLEVISDNRYKEATSPMLISILGLPCSGTTILNKFLNSLENGFMLCEPIWIYHQGKKNYDNTLHRKVKRYIKKAIGYYTLSNTNKPDFLELTQPKNFADEILQHALKNRYIFGGLKETFDTRRAFVMEHILNGGFDMHVFIFRDPLATFNSRKNKNRDSCYGDVEYFIDSYKRLYNIYLSQQEISRVLVYENFCDDTLSYRDKKLGDTGLKLKQLPNLVSKPFHANSGNKEAIKSTNIKKATSEYTKLSLKEITHIDDKLGLLYKSLYRE